MQAPRVAPSVSAITLVGMASLAAAMGIGRFAFTPLLPLMQQHDGLTLKHGAWLAAANYLGYLVGALLAFRALPAAGVAMRAGLLVVAIATAAMAFVASEAAWLVLRFMAGVASAFVLVGVSAWALGALAAAGRPALSGWVFGGVGLGIVIAGLVALAIAYAGLSPAVAWWMLGAGALLPAVAGWRLWRPDAATQAAPAAPLARRTPLTAAQWALVVAYGGFGFGYIIPATFIPAMARALVADPLVFGWAWPVFGAAAAVSTVVVTNGLRSMAPRTAAIGSLVVMAFGVLVPALAATLTTTIVSALCVGGTFMVMTMAGMQEARRLSSGAPARLMAAMTAAFAAGQLGGPIMVGAGASAATAVGGPSIAAALVLLASAALLLLGRRRSASA